MKSAIFFVASIAFIAAVPTDPQRIIGGEETSIEQYPFLVPVFLSWPWGYVLQCGGTIITSRSILTAVSCFNGWTHEPWAVRIGSTSAYSGGFFLSLSQFNLHPHYSSVTRDNDIAIVFTSGSFSYSPTVQPASIAGSLYHVGDNQDVWALGWGLQSPIGPASTNLRRVQVRTINHGVCASRYAELGRPITDNMLCSGWLEGEERGVCTNDQGGPLLHGNVVVGIASFGRECGSTYHPHVNTRVSRYTAWIQANA